MKNHHISEAGVNFEIQFCLWIKIWAGEHIFYIWQQTIAFRRVVQKWFSLLSKCIHYDFSVFAEFH